MAWDLAISENGDLIVTAHRDLAGISGQALIEQRIKLRLRLNRGQWAYDDTLGSQLYTLSGTPSTEAVKYVQSYVREALRDMEEISVVDVQLVPSDRDIQLIVVYQLELTQSDTLIPMDDNLQEISLTVPILGGNE